MYRFHYRHSCKNFSLDQSPFGSHEQSCPVVLSGGRSAISRRHVARHRRTGNPTGKRKLQGTIPLANEISRFSFKLKDYRQGSNKTQELKFTDILLLFADFRKWWFVNQTIKMGPNGRIWMPGIEYERTRFSKNIHLSNGGKFILNAKPGNITH